jgi:hypothetical protein
MGVLADQTIGKQETRPTEDFSLVVGGPLYDLLLRSKLIDPTLGHVGWRIAVITTITWLPLLVLTIVSGRFAGGVKVPFLYDFEVHARLLLAIPLLVLAELVVYIRMRAIAAQFVERQIITSPVLPAFKAVISSAIRLRNSLLAEILLLLLVVVFGPHVWRASLALNSDTWYGTVSSSGLNYTPAGYWYGFFSVAVFQFLLLRWYYRIVIWYRFLFQVSRLQLNLVAIHPDRCCGLGFLENVVSSFAPILMAHSAIVAGYIANRILQEGAKLPDYKFDLLGMAALLLAVALGSLCVFIPKLNNARLAGLRTYGALASDYVVSFAGKWVRTAKVDATEPESEPLLGSADIQSLADLANSFAIIKEVKLVPFSKQGVIRFLVAIAIPFGPLVFTMFSPEELLKRILTVVF